MNGLGSLPSRPLRRLRSRDMELIEIGEAGELPQEIVMDDFLQDVVEATVAHYQRTGFVSPWVGYIGLENGAPVGVCGFKSQPVCGRVEIAYGTSPGHEGKGVATALASRLIELAWHEDKSMTVVAQTLPETSASTSVLKKLGFRLIGTVDHPDDGLVWEWELPSA